MNSPRIQKSPSKRIYGGQSPMNAKMFTCKSKRRGGKSPNKSQMQRKHGGQSMYKPACASTSPHQLNKYGLSLYEYYKSVCPKTSDPDHKYMKNNKQLGNDQLRYDGDTCNYLNKIPQMKTSETGHLTCARARQRFADKCVQDSDSGHNHRVIVNTKAATKCAARISKRKKEDGAKIAAAKNKPLPVAWGVRPTFSQSYTGAPPLTNSYDSEDFPTLSGGFPFW
tara:strand:- start:115 stop:786 length:672 start_codon:yes stop_codon:yes gene_type:complete